MYGQLISVIRSSYIVGSEVGAALQSKLSASSVHEKQLVSSRLKIECGKELYWEVTRFTVSFPHSLPFLIVSYITATLVKLHHALLQALK